MNSVKWYFVVAVFALILAGARIECRADLGTIHFKDGKSITVEIVAADRGQVLWKMDSSPATEARPAFRGQIEYVDFPPTDSWTQAETAFESGKIDEAIQLYSQVAANRDFNYYPIPGNFGSLAHVRLLDCFRIKMDRNAIVKQAEVVRREFLNLPPDMRKFEPAIESWIAMSKKKWEEAITALDAEDPPTSEGFLLRGMALESLGKADEAVEAYAGAYVLNFGGEINIAKQALQRSAAILAKSGNEDRKTEIQAQAKIYRDLFGKGKLWNGAPDWLVKLADGEIVTLGKADPTEMAPVKSSETTVVATEKPETATLPDPDEREWVLVSEIPHKVYVRGRNPNEQNFKKLGGVTESEDGYVFDGTGGGIRLSGIDANQPAMVIQLVFVADSTEGAIFDLDSPRPGKRNQGGLGIYLRDGKLFVSWARKGQAPRSWVAGEVKPGEKTYLHIGASASTKVSLKFGDAEKIEVEKPAGALAIGPGLSACVGDTKVNDQDKFTADGKPHTPFKGKILHFSIGAGKDHKEIRDKEKAQFGGKIVRMRPPPPAG